MPVFSPRHKLREVLTPPLSTKASPGHVRWSSTPSKSNHVLKMSDSDNCNTPITPCRQRTQQTPRPQWSLPRAHYTYTDSPSSESEVSDIDDDGNCDDDCGNPTDTVTLGFTDSDKENLSYQLNINSQQEVIAKPATPNQSLEQPMVKSVADTSREQLLAQKCYDSAMEIMGNDACSAVSGGSQTLNQKSLSDDHPVSRSIDDLDRSCEGRDTESTTPSAEDNEEVPISSASFAQEGSEFQYNGKEVEMAQSPSESTTSSVYNDCEGEDTLSPLPQQQNDIVIKSPIPSLAQSNAAPTEAASSVATDLFAALRTTCSTACGGGNENDEDIPEETHRLSPIHPKEACLTAERKRWIHKTLLSKREYTPYQTKEREECCKNKDSHELTTERKKWIEETLLTNPAQDIMRNMSPKQAHGSFLATAYTEGNEVCVQGEEHLLDTARDDSTVATPMKSPQQCSQQLDGSFLASALVATNMLLTPPRREKYSAKPSRPRMSIGATPLPFASPFSPSSAASSSFTETASDIILHAIKQLTPKSSNRQEFTEKQKKITPSRKSDLLSIAAEMDYFHTVGSRDGKYEENRSLCNQKRLAERVEKLEQLVTGQYSRVSYNRQEEINELRSELKRTKHQLDNERLLVEEANQRASILMANLKASEKTHSDIENQLREKIQRLEAEVDCLRDYQKQVTSDQEKSTTEIVLSNECDDLDNLRRDNDDLVERQHTTERKHDEYKADNENLHSQLLALSNENFEKEQLLTSELDNLRSISENVSCVNQKLEQEVNAKKDEVTSMQRSLELVSCELIESTNEVKDLRSENARLHEELKRLKAGKKWLFP